jgi:hypothetical protein
MRVQAYGQMQQTSLHWNPKDSHRTTRNVLNVRHRHDDNLNKMITRLKLFYVTHAPIHRHTDSRRQLQLLCFNCYCYLYWYKLSCGSVVSAPEERQFSHRVMEPFGVFTAVKYAGELAAPRLQNHTHFWGSKAGKGIRGVYGCWYYINFINADKCLLTEEWSALPANPTPTSKKAGYDCMIPGQCDFPAP